MNKMFKTAKADAQKLIKDKMKEIVNTVKDIKVLMNGLSVISVARLSLMN